MSMEEFYLYLYDVITTKFYRRACDIMSLIIRCSKNAVAKNLYKINDPISLLSSWRLCDLMHALLIELGNIACRTSEDEAV